MVTRASAGKRTTREPEQSEGEWSGQAVDQPDAPANVAALSQGTAEGGCTEYMESAHDGEQQL